MSKHIAGWYLIYTMPRHEKKVAVKLSQINIISFMPTYKTLRVWKDRKRYVDAPLFPSYIFLYANDLEEYYRALSVEGALYYVKSGKEIAVISETIINNIRLLAKQENVEVTSDSFMPGRQVMIRNGLLNGFSGEIVEVKGMEKILVRVSLLQKNILVTLPTEDVCSLQIQNN